MKENESTQTKQASYSRRTIKNALIYSTAIIALFITLRQILPILIGTEYVAAIKLISLYGLIFLLITVLWFTSAILASDRIRKTIMSIAVLTGITLCLLPFAKLADASYDSLIIGYPSVISGLICIIAAMLIKFLRFGEENTPEFQDSLQHG